MIRKKTEKPFKIQGCANLNFRDSIIIIGQNNKQKLQTVFVEASRIATWAKICQIQIGVQTKISIAVAGFLFQEISDSVWTTLRVFLLKCHQFTIKKITLIMSVS